MKKLFAMALLVSGLMISMQSTAQTDEKAKKSPLVKATGTLASGATITIDYGQPSVKGRTIGQNLEPMDGKVWRTGANDATVFETDKEILVMGEKLPAGKYGLFTLFNGSEVTVIFNKTWKQWGAFKYASADDALRVTTKSSTASMASEKLTFNIGTDAVTMLWGDRKVEFTVK